MIGAALEGRYRIDAELGSGGVGAVYRGVHVALERPVAIKVLRAEYASSPEQRQRFEREARALASMSHPNIVAVTDFGVSGDVAYIVMDLLEGETLAQRIKRDGPMPRKDAIAVLKQLLRALAFVHAQNLVHRDVKPPNVFLQAKPDGELHVRLLDFGLAKVLSKDPNTKSLTRAGQIFGTPSYMAPEQVAGQESDARTDVYAAGIVLFEMLAGRAPFKGTAAEIFRQHLMEDLPMDALLPKDVRSPELDALIQKAAAKTRSDRFADGAEMLAAVEALPAYAAGTVTSFVDRPTAPGDATVRGNDPTAVVSPPLGNSSNSDAEQSVLTALPSEVSLVELSSSSIQEVSASEILSRFETEPGAAPFGSRLFRALSLVAIFVSVSTLGAAAYAVHVFLTPSKVEQRVVIERFLGLTTPPEVACLAEHSPDCKKGAPTVAKDEPGLAPTKAEKPAKPAAAEPEPARAPEKTRELAPAEAPQPSETPPTTAGSAAPAPSDSAATARPRAPAPNPWSTVPRDLASLVSKVNRGKSLEKKELVKVHEFNARRVDDPRGHLVLARSYSNRKWLKDAVNEYAIALKVSDNARGDPRMLPDLLRIVQFGSSEAERLVRDTFGESARPAIDKAILSVDSNPEAKARLERLRGDL